MPDHPGHDRWSGHSYLVGHSDRPANWASVVAVVHPSDLDIPVAVAELAEVHPRRLPMLRVMSQLAEDNVRLPTGPHRPMFDAEMVRLRLRGTVPGNLSFFVNRGFIVTDDQSRNHRYYVMERWQEVRHALDQLK